MDFCTFWPVLQLTIYIQDQCSVSVQEVLYRNTESKGVESCSTSTTFMQETGVLSQTCKRQGSQKMLTEGKKTLWVCAHMVFVDNKKNVHVIKSKISRRDPPSLLKLAITLRKTQNSFSAA